MIFLSDFIVITKMESVTYPLARCISYLSSPFVQSCWLKEFAFPKSHFVKNPDIDMHLNKAY